MRMVFDTNVLIDSANDDLSTQAKLIEAACLGKLTALATSAIQREYRTLLRRLITDEVFVGRIEEFITATEVVPEAAVEVTLDDREDHKFLRAGVGGHADLIVTNDHHLLDVGEVGSVRIVRPTEAWVAFREASGSTSEWQSWVRGLGLGK